VWERNPNIHNMHRLLLCFYDNMVSPNFRMGKLPRLCYHLRESIRISCVDFKIASVRYYHLCSLCFVFMAGGFFIHQFFVVFFHLLFSGVDGKEVSGGGGPGRRWTISGSNRDIGLPEDKKPVSNHLCKKEKFCTLNPRPRPRWRSLSTLMA